MVVPWGRVLVTTCEWVGGLDNAQPESKAARTLTITTFGRAESQKTDLAAWQPSMPVRAIPKGLQRSAQACKKRATLGPSIERIANPEGGMALT